MGEDGQGGAAEEGSGPVSLITNKLCHVYSTQTPRYITEKAADGQLFSCCATYVPVLYYLQGIAERAVPLFLVEGGDGMGTYEMFTFLILLIALILAIKF